VSPCGEMDLATRDELRASLHRCTGDVVVDLSEVEFLDASCLGVLVAEHTRLTQDGGTLRLCEPQGLVTRVLEITGLVAWIVENAVGPRSA
jgi:anti-anti-sigma factor